MDQSITCLLVWTDEGTLMQGVDGCNCACSSRRMIDGAIQYERPKDQTQWPVGFVVSVADEGTRIS